MHLLASSKGATVKEPGLVELPLQMADYAKDAIYFEIILVKLEGPVNGGATALNPVRPRSEPFRR